MIQILGKDNKLITLEDSERQPCEIWTRQQCDGIL